MKDDKKDILEQKDKGISKARGALAMLFRTILYDLDITGPEWEVLMQRVLDDPRGPAPRNSKDRSSLKGNLNKALKGDRMSWKTFQKALRLLGPNRLRLEAHLEWPKGTTTVHHIKQHVGGFRPEDFVDVDGAKKGKFSVQTAPASIRLQHSHKSPGTVDASDPVSDIEAAMAQIARDYGSKPKAVPNVRKPSSFRQPPITRD